VSTACPYLYRDERDRFMCHATRHAVDPALMPCLSDFLECPYYKEETARREAEKEAEKEARVEAPAAPEEREIPVVTVPEAAAEIEEKEYAEYRVLALLTNVDSICDRLDESWTSYEKEVNNLLSLWEEIERESKLILEAVNNVLDTYNKIIVDLEYKLKNKLISEADYKELREKTKQVIDRYEELKERIISRFREAEKRVMPHFQRVKMEEAKPLLGRLRLTLIRLQDMRKEGKISEEAYTKLREELETRIKVLERITGERE